MEGRKGSLCYICQVLLITLGKQILCLVPGCRHSANILFVECSTAGTRQSLTAVTATARQGSHGGTCHLCRVPRVQHSATYCFVVCLLWSTRQIVYLPSGLVLPSVFFITHGIVCVCRVLEILHSANLLALGNNGVSGSALYL